jgi:hypothetical protein
MSRRSDLLITHIRAITENETANSSTDISDNDILQYINEGQQRLQSKILSVNPRSFIKEKVISTVSGTEEYSLPDDCFLFNRIISVEYTDDLGSLPSYSRLTPSSERKRASHILGLPSRYIRQDKQNDSTASILLSPVPSSVGQLRIRYVQQLDLMDIRRGVVDAVTLTSTEITALNLDLDGTPTIDSTAILLNDYMCVVDKYGTIKMRNIPFDSVNTTTGAVTITAGFAFESGETIAVGDYIVLGKNTSTHSKFPKHIERYLITYATYKIFKRDSSLDVIDQKEELKSMEEEIINSYAEIESDDPAEIEIIEEWDEFF